MQLFGSAVVRHCNDIKTDKLISNYQIRALKNAVLLIICKLSVSKNLDKKRSKFSGVNILKIPIHQLSVKVTCKVGSKAEIY